MKLDTSAADRLPPYVKGYTDQGEGRDSLPEVFYAAWQRYLKSNPIKYRNEELEESDPDSSAGKRVAIYYSELRRHLQQTMFQWLEAHDGVVDRWPFPALDGWGGVVQKGINYATGESTEVSEYPFELFAPSYSRDVPNGFTNCDSPKPPEKPHICTDRVSDYRKHYWDSYNEQKKEYEFQVRTLQDYKKENFSLKKGLRITPLKVLAMLLLTFLALNSVVLFFYCFTGLFDYQKLVDGLYGFTQSGFLPVQILAWPVFVLQYINYFLFRNFVPLREESIIATVIGYVILLVLLLMWLGVLMLGKNFIFSSTDPFGKGSATDRKKLSKTEKEISAREKRVREMKEKLDAEKARLEQEYQNDIFYQQCVKKDKERTKWLKDTYPRREANYKAELQKYQPYKDMIRAYYDYLVKLDLIKDPPQSDDWLPKFVPIDYDY